MAKKVKLKDRNNNQILPITRATTVEMNDGTNMQEKLDSIEDNILEVNYNSGNTALVFGSVYYTVTLDDFNPGLVDENNNPITFPMQIKAGDSFYVKVLHYDWCEMGWVYMGNELIRVEYDSNEDIEYFYIPNVTDNIICTFHEGPHKY